MNNEQLRKLLNENSPRSNGRNSRSWIDEAQVTGEPLLETDEYIFQSFSFSINAFSSKISVLFYDKVTDKTFTLSSNPNQTRIFKADIEYHYKIAFVYYMAKMAFGFVPYTREYEIYNKAMHALYAKFDPHGRALLDVMNADKFYMHQRNLTLKIDNGKELAVTRDRWVDWDKKEIQCDFHIVDKSIQTDEDIVQNGLIIRVVNREGIAPSLSKLYKGGKVKDMIDKFFLV